MKYSIEHVVFYRHLSAEQVESLQQMLAADSEAARLFRRWRAVRETLARDLDAAAVDRHVFSLFVLSESGRRDVLSARDRARVEDAAPMVRAALGRYGGLSIVADDIRSDADEFEAAWEEWFGKGGDASDASRRRLQDPPARGTPEPRDREGRDPKRRDLPPARRRSRSSRWLVRAGIGAAVVVFVALLLLLGRRDFASVTVTTASGEVRHVELGDGSAVRMLGDSRLTYVPAEKASALDRRAEFDGRGFFEIAADDQGFVVQTPNAQAVVLGTSFGLRTDAEETEVVLVEGRLSLAPRHTLERSVVLSSGQMSRVEASQHPSAPVDVRVHARLAWTGLFVFIATPLEEILAALGRFYEIDITGDEALHGEQVTGRFDQELEPLEILDVVAAAVGARVQRTGEGGYRLVPS